VKPIERITLLCVLIAVADACTSDKPLLGPGGSRLQRARAGSSAPGRGCCSWAARL
jgi:hypothetical protein